jgi:integrase
LGELPCLIDNQINAIYPMPLYVRRRKDTGRLEIHGVVRAAGTDIGVRVRHRAGTDDEALAAEEAHLLEAMLLREAYHGERRAARTFAEAAVSYLKHEPRTSGTKGLVRKLTVHFAHTKLDKINQEAVDGARDKLLRPGAAPGTVRRNIIAPTKAVLIHASKRGWCPRPDFDMPREARGRTTFLMPDHVEALIAAAAPHIRPLLVFLICTGCRLGEALAIDWSQVDLPGARVILFPDQTKARVQRAVHLTPRAIADLAGLPGRDGHVFRAPHGEAYRQSVDGGGGQLRSVWASACRNAGLPGETRERQRGDRPGKHRSFNPVHSPHILRHSWASWKWALDKDLIRLQHDGGWSDVKLVTRYAHLVPVGHEAAIRAVWGDEKTMP